MRSIQRADHNQIIDNSERIYSDLTATNIQSIRQFSAADKQKTF
jgi:hypothetical protein